MIGHTKAQDGEHTSTSMIDYEDRGNPYRKVNRHNSVDETACVATCGFPGLRGGGVVNG